MAEFRIDVPKIKLPEFDGFSRQFWDDVGDDIEAGIIENVLKQKRADGARLRKNTRATLKVKARKGRGARSLIDEQHRFIKGSKGSWKILRYLPEGRGIVVGGATLWLNRMVRRLAKKEYTGYIGVNKNAAKAISKHLKEEIVRQLKKAAK